MVAVAGSFSGHETFPFRHAWMKKGVDAVDDNPNIFGGDDAMSVLGVGKNMVRSIRHWCLASGILEQAGGKSRSGLKVSWLGMALFGDEGHDPYLEDPATSWILHWQLTSRPEQATTWYWAFCFVNEPEFSKVGLVRSLKAWIETGGMKRVSDGTLDRDVDCFLRTYSRAKAGQQAVAEDTLDCPLVELGLIVPSSDDSTYAFSRGAHSTLSDAVVHYAVCDYWRAHASNRKALALAELAHRPGSPGRVFKLDESSLAERFERLEKLTAGRLAVRHLNRNKGWSQCRGKPREECDTQGSREDDG